MHSMTTFAVLEGESRDDSSDQQQQAAMFVSDILEKLALSPRSAHQSPLKITRSLLILYNEGLSEFLLPFEASFQSEDFGSNDYMHHVAVTGHVLFIKS